MPRPDGRPPSMYEQLEKRCAASVPIVSRRRAFIFLPILSLFLTALYWAFFNALLGGTATFKQVLAVVTHSQVIARARRADRRADSADDRARCSMGGPFNLGALAPMLDEGSFLSRFLGFISVFRSGASIVLRSAWRCSTGARRRTSRSRLIVVYLSSSTGVLDFGLAFGRFRRVHNRMSRKKKDHHRARASSWCSAGSPYANLGVEAARRRTTVNVEKIETARPRVHRLGERQDPAEDARSTSAPRRWARSSNLEVDEGDMVTKGQLLLQIDPRNLETRCRTARPAWRPRESQLDQTKAQIENARVALREAEDTLRRQERLCKAGLLPREQLRARARTTSSVRETDLMVSEQSAQHAGAAHQAGGGESRQRPVRPEQGAHRLADRRHRHAAEHRRGRDGGGRHDEQRRHRAADDRRPVGDRNRDRGRRNRHSRTSRSDSPRRSRSTRSPTRRFRARSPRSATARFRRPARGQQAAPRTSRSS